MNVQNQMRMLWSGSVKISAAAQTGYDAKGVPGAPQPRRKKLTLKSKNYFVQVLSYKYFIQEKLRKNK